MKMQKRQFRIGQLAKKLNVERFVVRFWEKEFNIKTDRSSGKQRFYNEDDLAQFILIKELLYEKGFTISGAKKQLMQNGKKPSTTTIIASKKTDFEDSRQNESDSVQQPYEKEQKKLFDQILKLRKQLIKLKAQL